MFDAARSKVASRLLEGSKYLSLASPANPPKPPDVTATCKGLLFVQLYGVYDEAVRDAVQAALDAVRTGAPGSGRLRGSLLALTLHPEWQGAADAGQARVWAKRIELIDELARGKPSSDLDNTLFPSDGSNFRTSQLETLWHVFGVTSPFVPEQRLRGRIHELVGHRNANAHGRLTAREIGSRYSLRDMELRVRDTGTIALHVIESMRAHCETGGLTV